MSRIKATYCEPCGGKRIYRTEIQARDGLGRVIRMKGNLTKRDDTFGIYPCPNGTRGFHIGHDSIALKTLTDALKEKGTKQCRKDGGDSGLHSGHSQP